MSVTVAAERRPQKLALIVGSNPLPNYLAAMVLSPKEVVLLYSRETVASRDNLQAVLSAKGIKVPRGVYIDEATDARKIQDACTSLHVDHLHYSGGTKPMAAHARATVKDESQASYLDERKGLLRFDDGCDIELRKCDLGLTLDVLLQLHGSKRKDHKDRTIHGAADQGTGDPADDDERVRNALTNGALEGLGHDGRWLEDWVARRIRSCISDAKPEVGVVVERCVSRRDFEIDVTLIRGYRLFVVSCTTSKKLDRSKSKLFEVAMRAKQMGGDLARSAVVSAIDGSDQQGRDHAELLRADIASVWDAPHVPKVFGLADLREWAGVTGEPNLRVLKEWLDS